MFRTSTLLLTFVFVTTLTLGQSVLQEKVIEKSEKGLNFFTSRGLKSVYVPDYFAAVTPAIEFCDVPGDGFLMRNEYKFIKYNEKYEKEWEKEIPQKYAFINGGLGYIMARKDVGIYFLELKSHPTVSALNITRFDNKGNISQKEFITPVKYDRIHGSFISDKGLHLITYTHLNKEKKIRYSLLTFSHSDLKNSEKELLLEQSNREVSEVSPLAAFEYGWVIARALDGKAIMQKVYFDYDTKLKKSTMVFKTVEVDADGQLHNLRDYSFTGKQELRYARDPNVFVNTIKNEAYVYGYAVGSTKREGIYIFKYDYQTGKSIGNYEYNFKDIAAKTGIEEKAFNFSYITNFSEIYEVRKRSSYFYHNINFRSYIHPSVNYWDEYNDQLVILTYNGIVGSLTSSTEAKVFYFDKGEKLVKIEAVTLAGFPTLEQQFRSTPQSVKKLWGNGEVHPNAFTFIQNFAGKSDPKGFFWEVLQGKEYDLLFSVKESEGEIKVYKMKK